MVLTFASIIEQPSNISTLVKILLILNRRVWDIWQTYYQRQIRSKLSLSTIHIRATASLKLFNLRIIFETSKKIHKKGCEKSAKWILKSPTKSKIAAPKGTWACFLSVRRYWCRQTPQIDDSRERESSSDIIWQLRTRCESVKENESFQPNYLDM